MSFPLLILFQQLRATQPTYFVLVTLGLLIAGECLVDRRGARLCTICCVWSVDPLVYLCGCLLGDLPLALSVVRGLCFSGNESAWL